MPVRVDPVHIELEDPDAMTRTHPVEASTNQEITRKSKSSFYYSFLLLPREKREAMFTVYAVCRRVDDCVDEATDTASAEAQLDGMRKLVNQAYSGTAACPLGSDLAKVVHRFSIPRFWFEELIRGVAMDLQKQRYSTYQELQEYCYRVASVVGMICIEIFGYRNKITRSYAETLGLALQMTNIIRDVGDDAKKGRIYLPTEELSRFGFSEQDLLEHQHDERFVRLMTFQYERTLDLFRRARRLYPREDRRTLFPAEIMRSVYEKLLQRIHSRRFHVFDERIRVSKAGKIGSALGIYVRDGLLAGRRKDTTMRTATASPTTHTSSGHPKAGA